MAAPSDFQVANAQQVVSAASLNHLPIAAHFARRFELKCVHQQRCLSAIGARRSSRQVGVRKINCIRLVIPSVAVMLLGFCAAVFAGNERWFVDFLYEEEQMSCDSVILRNNSLIFPFFGESKIFRMKEDSAGDVWIRDGFHYPYVDLYPESGEFIVRFAVIVNDGAQEGEPPILGRSEPWYFVRNTNTTLNLVEVLHDIENAFRESEVRGPLILVTGSYLFSQDADPVLAALYVPGEHDGTVRLEAEYQRFTRASALDVFGARPTHTCFRTIPGLAFVDD